MRKKTSSGHRCDPAWHPRSPWLWRTKHRWFGRWDASAKENGRQWVNNEYAAIQWTQSTTNTQTRLFFKTVEKKPDPTPPPLIQWFPRIPLICLAGGNQGEIRKRKKKRKYELWWESRQIRRPTNCPGCPGGGGGVMEFGLEDSIWFGRFGPTGFNGVMKKKMKRDYIRRRM